MSDDDPIPLSALQYAVYCLHQAALIHIERLWEENRFTAEGRVVHLAADAPGQRYSRGVRRISAMPLAKIANQRTVLQRALRDHGEDTRKTGKRP